MMAKYRQEEVRILGQIKGRGKNTKICNRRIIEYGQDGTYLK
jgi:hypothetical protein